MSIASSIDAMFREMERDRYAAQNRHVRQHLAHYGLTAEQVHTYQDRVADIGHRLKIVLERYNGKLA